MDDLIRRSDAQELLKCYTEKNNLGHTPYQIVSHLPSAGPKWVSVEERLPEKEGGFIVAVTQWGTDFAYFVPGLGFGMYDTSEGLFHWNGCDDITHWMPLPEPPGGNNESNT